MTTPDRWQEIQGLFQQAVDLDAAAQAQWLDEACGEDRALRDEDFKRIRGAAPRKCSA